MQHQQYFLMLERAPGYFWVEFFVRESKRFMVERNLIFYSTRGATMLPKNTMT